MNNKPTPGSCRAARCWLLCALALFPPLGVAQPAVVSTIPTYGYKVVNAYPHDTDAFTEGLFYRDGFLY